MQSDIYAYERTIVRDTNIVLESLNKRKNPIQYIKDKIEAIILDKDIEKDVPIEVLHNKIDSLPKNKAELINSVALIFGYYVITKKK